MVGERGCNICVVLCINILTVIIAGLILALVLWERDIEITIVSIKRPGIDMNVYNV